MFRRKEGLKKWWERRGGGGLGLDFIARSMTRVVMDR